MAGMKLEAEFETDFVIKLVLTVLKRKIYNSHSVILNTQTILHLNRDKLVFNLESLLRARFHFVRLIQLHRV